MAFQIRHSKLGLLQAIEMGPNIPIWYPTTGNDGLGLFGTQFTFQAEMIVEILKRTTVAGEYIIEPFDYELDGYLSCTKLIIKE